MKKKSVYEESQERLAKADGQDVYDTTNEINKKYLDEVQECIKNHSHFNEPFYIVVLYKIEKLMQNVIRRYYVGRLSLPTPSWSQDVWRYNPATGDLEFIWSLPEKSVAMWLVDRPHDIKDEHKQLKNFVVYHLEKKLYKYFYDKYHKNDKELVNVKDTPYKDNIISDDSLLSTS